MIYIQLPNDIHEHAKYQGIVCFTFVKVVFLKQVHLKWFSVLKCLLLLHTVHVAETSNLIYFLMFRFWLSFAREYILVISLKVFVFVFILFFSVNSKLYPPMIQKLPGVNQNLLSVVIMDLLISLKMLLIMQSNSSAYIPKSK